VVWLFAGIGSLLVLGSAVAGALTYSDASARARAAQERASRARPAAQDPDTPVEAPTPSTVPSALGGLEPSPSMRAELLDPLRRCVQETPSREEVPSTRVTLALLVSTETGAVVRVNGLEPEAVVPPMLAACLRRSLVGRRPFIAARPVEGTEEVRIPFTFASRGEGAR
jgi:hypothetical protein